MQTSTKFNNKNFDNSRSQIVFRTDIFRKLSLGAPVLWSHFHLIFSCSQGVARSSTNFLHSLSSSWDSFWLFSCSICVDSCFYYSSFSGESMFHSTVISKINFSTLCSNCIEFESINIDWVCKTQVLYSSPGGSFCHQKLALDFINFDLYLWSESPVCGASLCSWVTRVIIYLFSLLGCILN